MACCIFHVIAMKHGFPHPPHPITQESVHLDALMELDNRLTVHVQQQLNCLVVHIAALALFWPLQYDYLYLLLTINQEINTLNKQNKQVSEQIFICLNKK